VVFLVGACIEAWTHFSAVELLFDHRGGGGAPGSQERGVLNPDSRDHFLQSTSVECSVFGIPKKFLERQEKTLARSRKLR
jgi:hypothetical protein